MIITYLLSLMLDDAHAHGPFRRPHLGIRMPIQLVCKVRKTVECATRQCADRLCKGRATVPLATQRCNCLVEQAFDLRDRSQPAEKAAQQSALACLTCKMASSNCHAACKHAKCERCVCHRLMLLYLSARASLASIKGHIDSTNQHFVSVFRLTWCPRATLQRGTVVEPVCLH